MSARIATAISLLLAATIFLAQAQAEGQRGQKGKGPRAGRQGAEAGAFNGDGMQHRNMVRQRHGGMQGGMMGRQAIPNAAQMAQIMLTNFDLNGDRALDQAELESAMQALMLHLQQMQAMQRNARGQAVFGVGMMGAAAQAACQGGGMMGQNQMRARAGNGQFAVGQRGGPRGGAGAPARRGGGGKKGR